MFIYLLGVVIVFLCIEIYKRYYPVKGISCRENVDENKNIVVLDIRDYNEKEILTNSGIQIPYAYLKRYFGEIPDQPLHVVATDRMELNLVSRFLLRRGHHVSSFEILNCPCREKER